MPRNQFNNKYVRPVNKKPKFYWEKLKKLNKLIDILCSNWKTQYC